MDFHTDATLTRLMASPITSLMTADGLLFRYGGGFTPTLNVMERADAAGTKWGSIAKIEGPCCFGGCSELCCESNWPVSRLDATNFDQKLMLGDFATITKKVPRSFGRP